jgi:hypothetical protein
MRRTFNAMRRAACMVRTRGLKRYLMDLANWGLQQNRPAVARSLRYVVREAKDVSVDPLLIYQMSKVGSTSLLYSLQWAYLRAGLARLPIHHTHTLTQLDYVEKLAMESNYLPAERVEWVRQYRKIRSDFDARPCEHWNVITLVRDPVARHISDFFHHIDRNLPDWRRRWGEESLGMDEVMQSFLHSPDHAYEWFDAEIQTVLGIDVYSQPFPHHAGYCMLSRLPKVTLLVLRLEDLNRVAREAVKALTRIRHFTLTSFNLGRETEYCGLYEKFKSLPLPAAYVERAYSSKLATHFYTPAERERMTRKWTQGNAPARCASAHG